MTFKTREEFFLAKIAGHDVDIATLTPPVPVNTTEKLLLEIAEAAAASAEGAAKIAENVPEAAGSAPTAAEFKALLDALIAAGIMKEAKAQD